MATLIVLHLKRLKGPLIYEQKLKIDHLLRGLQNNQQQNIKYAGRKSFQKIDMMFSLFESIHAIFFPESLTNKLKIICSFCDDSIGIFVLRSIFFWGWVILDDYSSLLLISKAYLFILTILCSSDKDVKSWKLYDEKLSIQTCHLVFFLLLFRFKVCFVYMLSELESKFWFFLG